MREARERLCKAKLPPRMERAAKEEGDRREEEFKRIQKELEAECTHHPKIHEGKTREEFEQLHARRARAPTSSPLLASPCITVTHVDSPRLTSLTSPHLALPSLTSSHPTPVCPATTPQHITPCTPHLTTLNPTPPLRPPPDSSGVARVGGER